MLDWRLQFVLLVVGIMLAVYFYRSFRQAQDQKRMASRLKSYLIDCNDMLFEGPFSEYLFMGHIWQEKQAMDAFAEQGFKGVEKARKNFKEKLSELKSSIEKNEEEICKSIERQHRTYKNMSPELFANTVQQIQAGRDTLKENISSILYHGRKTFPGYALQCAVQMKESLHIFADKALDVALALRKMDSLNIRSISDELYEIVKNVILFSRYYLSLASHAHCAGDQFLLTATVRNMLLMQEFPSLAFSIRQSPPLSDVNVRVQASDSSLII